MMAHSTLKTSLFSRNSRKEKHNEIQDHRLPPDMLLEIAQSLAEPGDILKFCLTVCGSEY